MTQKAPFAQIHEQGYERYTGARSEQGSRFWIVAKNVASIAWRSRWAVKIPIVLTALTVMALAGVMFLSKGAQVPQPGSGQLVPIEVAIILGSTGWLTLLATILGTALGCSTVADDLKVGAFQFYFSRSLRANDYAIGKLLGVAAVVGVPLLVAPTLLALVRVGLCKDATELGETWAILPRAVAWGLSGTLTFTLVSIGLGAALANRRAAQAGFLVWYLVIGSIAKVVAQVTKTPEAGLFALDANWGNAGRLIFDLPKDNHMPASWQSLAALGVLAAAGYAGLLWRVRGAEVSSVGGGS
ncbi:MAG: hypothetical protein IPM79_35105 [Polyangiaceae bacterium]|jgi:hypothetical protein|nr:hypothetical protein [Polyangiaceae bacterium]MBK8942687.1 hypothetical protein [Polyangiaceae bacterium]